MKDRTAEREIAMDSPDVKDRVHPRDQEVLLRFGKKQQFKRNFGMISIIGLTSTLMITWEGVLAVFQGGLTNGGPTGLLTGFIFAWVGNMLQGLVMGELGSMIPLSGGQYNWVAVLAPRSSRKFLSYMTGWVTLIAWIAVTAGVVFIVGSMIQGVVIINNPDYVPQRWHTTLIFYAVVAFALFINTYLAHFLPHFEALVLVIHIVGFFGVLVPLVYMSSKSSTAAVWQNFFNLGGWESDGLSFFVGSVTNMFAFIGIDGATHLAEEIKDSSSVIPKTMIITILLNGTLGFAMLIASLFCIGNIDDVLKTDTGFPFMQIFLNATSSKSGATGMACIIIVVFASTSCGALAASSRMLWAFAREKGVPGSYYIAQVHSPSALPLWAIGVTTVANLLLALINIGSTTAFNALTGLTVCGFYASFLIAAFVMLHKRLTTADSDIHWGPFKLGRWGVPITLLSIAYSLLGFFFSFFPPTKEVTPVTMNWSSAVFGGVLLLSLVHWFFFARHVYTGPVVEVDYQEDSIHSRTKM